MDATIKFTLDDGSEVTFTVIAETRLNEINYLLVTEEDNDEYTYIMKETGDDASDMIYEMVEDDKEIDAVATVFDELLEDIDIEK